jgi:hypothetical protein
VILSNHGKYDDTPRKLDAVDRRAPGASPPYVVGKESVGRFFTVAEHCALPGRVDGPRMRALAEK